MITTILLVFAFVLFAIDTFKVQAKVNLQAAGLACAALAMILRGYA
jgi:hypothetical protein